MIAKIKGMRELQRMLKKVPAKIQNKASRAAVREASTPMLRDVRRRAKTAIRSRSLGKSIGRRIKTYRRNGVTVAVIGPRLDFVSPSGTKIARLAHLIEFGTARRFQRKTKRTTGFMRASPFLRPAFDSHKREYVKLYSARMAREVTRLMTVKKAK